MAIPLWHGRMVWHLFWPKSRASLTYTNSGDNSSGDHPEQQSKEHRAVGFLSACRSRSFHKDVSLLNFLWILFQQSDEEEMLHFLYSKPLSVLWVIHSAVFPYTSRVYSWNTRQQKQWPCYKDQIWLWLAKPHVTTPCSKLPLCALACTCLSLQPRFLSNSAAKTMSESNTSTTTKTAVVLQNVVVCAESSVRRQRRFE